jgi:hypothetical protein
MGKAKSMLKSMGVALGLGFGAYVVDILDTGLNSTVFTALSTIIQAAFLVGAGFISLLVTVEILGIAWPSIKKFLNL